MTAQYLILADSDVQQSRVVVLARTRRRASQANSGKICFPFPLILFWLVFALIPVAASESDEVAAKQSDWAFATFESKCAICHGEDGAGLGEVTLNLADDNWIHGSQIEDVIRVIRDGVGETAMKAHAETFSAEQIQDLARFVILLSSRATTGVEPKPNTEKPIASETKIKNPGDGEPRLSEDFIDRFIFDKMKADGVPHADRCSDGEFVRRVYLDLWGRLPDTKAVRDFLASEDPDKRNKLIDELLGLNFDEAGKQSHSPWNVGAPFLSKWRYFFEDLFRNYDEDGADTTAFRNYIYEFLKGNVPYDVVVRDMLTANAMTHSSNGASGFLVRQSPSVVVSVHEDACDENAVYVARNFLGLNLQCISCHDGAPHLEKINLWLTKRKRTDFWNFASFFGDTWIFRRDREYVLFDGRIKGRELGKTEQSETVRGLSNFHFENSATSATPGYRMDAHSTLRAPRDRSKAAEIAPAFIVSGERPAKGVNPRHELARLITESDQFAKVTVNLMWAQFMTVGIVDPPLDWDLDRQDPKNPPPKPWSIQPSHPELLDALAKDFQQNNFSLRHLMRLICRSRAYQLSSSFNGEYKPEWDRYYARKLVRRLWAQEIYDAVLAATTLTLKDTDYAMNSKGPIRDVLIGHDTGISRFLNAFGQCNRDTKEADTSNTSMMQAGMLLNSEVVKTRVLASTEGSRVSKLLQEYPPWTWRTAADNPKKIVEELYLVTLSRFPTADEMLKAIDHLNGHRDVGVEDLQWALINQPEFVLSW